jgi:hypothetical protein
MTYTNETLHGVVYYHRNDGPKALRKIIMASSPINDYTHTDCLLTDGKTAAAWFNLKQAQGWIKDGIWILAQVPEKINNTYSIY